MSSNRNTSSSAISRSERDLVLQLRVVTGVGRKGSSSSRPLSEVWNYFGYLHKAKEASSDTVTAEAEPCSSSGISYEPVPFCGEQICPQNCNPQSSLAQAGSFDILCVKIGSAV